MFNSPTLIGFLLTVIIAYVSLYFNCKKEIKDLMLNENEENKKKITNREGIIKSLKITSISIIAIILFLYYCPSVISFFETFTSNKNVFAVEYIKEMIMKILPFSDDFFANSKFQFSFITGIILSIIVFFLFSVCVSDFKFVIKTILKILLIWLLIWANYFISSFLVFCIVNWFELISIFLNLIAYVIVSLILFFLLSLLTISTSNNNIEKDFESHDDIKCLPSSDELNDSASQITLELEKEEFEIEEILESIDSKKLLSSSQKNETQ